MFRTAREVFDRTELDDLGERMARAQDGRQGGAGHPVNTVTGRRA